MKKRLLAVFLAVVMAVSLLSVMAFADGEDTTVSETPSASEESTETETPDETEAPAETEEPVESEEPADPDETEDSDETEEPAESEEPGESEEPDETEEPETTEGTFSDVDEDDWFYETVQWAQENGIMQGSDGKFSPYNNLTRGEIWTMLARMYGVDTTQEAGSDWYQKGLDWSVENDVSDGTNPTGTITREQLAVMLYRYVGKPDVEDPSAILNDYPDNSSVDTWEDFPEAMAWAVANEIIGGIPQGDTTVLNPQGTATRAEAATMVKRFCENVLETELGE